MNYLNIIPHDIYIHIYKYIYNDCMKELIYILNNRRNNKYKYKLIKNILNDENRVYYTSLSIFNLVSLKIIRNNDNSDVYYHNSSDELEELYYLSEINVNNFLIVSHFSFFVARESACSFRTMEGTKNADLVRFVIDLNILKKNAFRRVCGWTWKE